MPPGQGFKGDFHQPQIQGDQKTKQNKQTNRTKSKESEKCNGGMFGEGGKEEEKQNSGRIKMGGGHMGFKGRCGATKLDATTWRFGLLKREGPTALSPHYPGPSSPLVFPTFRMMGEPGF